KVIITTQNRDSKKKPYRIQLLNGEYITTGGSDHGSASSASILQIKENAGKNDQSNTVNYTTTSTT
ncbi:15820_t:CDS:2, partial [Gigaspora rosea]